MAAFIISLLFVCMSINVVAGCGPSTHFDIAHRAREHYRQVTSSYDYRNLIDKHEDAFLGGIPYPDSFYSDICKNGVYHDISEDTHWGEFLNATVNYIRKQPKPWDEATEKLVAFMMGLLSHQVSDILWHSLGIDQGFLTTMGYVDFHGVYSTAHTVGDVGGDMVINYMFNLNKYINPVQTWYIPVDDLYNIYEEFYGTKKISKNTIRSCSAIQVLLLIAELIGAFELYPGTAYLSPFLVDNFYNYFQGGIEDMSGWTNRRWHDYVTMLENGTSACYLPHNPLFINCTKSEMGRPRRGSSNEKNGYFVRPKLRGLNIKDLDIEHAYRGIKISLGTDLQEKLVESRQIVKATIQKEELLRNERRKLANATDYQPRIMFTVNSTNSMLGWSLATGDIDKDGNEDLVIGAPGYGEDTKPQIGRVFVVYGHNTGLYPASDSTLAVDVNNLSYGHNRILTGNSQPLCKFGYAVVVLDVNLDGFLDIGVGAPSYRNGGHFGYNGMILIYFGKGTSREWSEHPDIIVTCKEMYCTLGITLSALDVTGDGHVDLVIGSPYTSSSKIQSGLVTAVPSSSSYKGHGQEIPVESLSWGTVGDQAFSWFGYNIQVKKGVMIVSQPNFRLCKDPRCQNYTKTDRQSVGKLSLFNFKDKVKISNLTMKGQNEFDSFGFSADIGDPFGNGTIVLAVGAPNRNVSGRIMKLAANLMQAGMVMLYKVEGADLLPIGQYMGDRSFSRFGTVVKFADVNRDGIDDLLIGAPFRNEDVSQLLGKATHGVMYGFFGGKQFPVGSATISDACQDIAPCPGIVANITTEYPCEDTKSFFGNNAAVLISKNKTQLIVSSSRNSKSSYFGWYGESGRVYVYDTWQ